MIWVRTVCLNQVETTLHPFSLPVIINSYLLLPQNESDESEKENKIIHKKDFGIAFFGACDKYIKVFTGQLILMKETLSSDQEALDQKAGCWYGILSHILFSLPNLSYSPSLTVHTVLILYKN